MMEIGNPVFIVIMISSGLQIVLTLVFSLRKFRWNVPPTETMEEDPLPKYSTLVRPDEAVIEMQPLPPAYTRDDRTA